MVLTSLEFAVLEWAGVLFNFGFVIAAIYRKQIAWPLGIIGSLLGAIYFLVLEKPLLAEASLYFFYVIMGIHGWMVWHRLAQKSNEITITVMSVYRHFVVITIAALLACGLGYYLSVETQSDLPLFDAFTTVFAVFATFLEIKRRLYTWVYWIFLNAASIWLYALKESNIYAGLMVIYTALSIYGFIQWRNYWKAQREKELDDLFVLPEGD